jgi:hypothetical protein
MNLPEKEAKLLFKEAAKEAIKEWADDKYALVGKWTVSALIVALVAAMCWFVLTMNGWTAPWQIDFVKHVK